MLSLKQYLLSIIATAIFVSIITKLISNKSPHYVFIQTIAGVLIVMTIIAPLSNMQLDAYLFLYEDLTVEAQGEIDHGVESANTAIRAVIKEQTETYILEKADSMGADLRAQITLDSGNQPFPIAVKISGDVSPYVKKQLISIISNDIGIPEEMQTWT